MKQLLVLVFAVITSLGAQAQNYGFLAGISNNNADTGSIGGTADAALGFRVGFIADMDLVNQFSFRTGVGYSDRSFAYKNSVGAVDIDVKLGYLDIPALFKFAFNDFFSVYAGPVVAINMSDKLDGSSAAGSVDGSFEDNGNGKVKSLYLLGQIGVNFNFDGIGFDVYYERGLGDINKDGFKDFNVFGANYVMLF